jgi:flagellar protein FliS
MIAEQYETQKIMAASPMELIVILYDHAIRNLSKAMDAFEIKEEPERVQALNNNLLRAQDFIAELACSLDIERGGEMALQLSRLYDFMLNYLTEANNKQCRESIESVHKILTELREGWTQALATIPRNEQPQEVPVERTSSFSFAG